MLTVTPTSEMLLRVVLRPVEVIGWLMRFEGKGSSGEAFLLLTKGVTGPTVNTGSKGPSVRVRAVDIGPMAVSTNKGPAIRLRTSAVGSELVVTPG